MKRQIITIPGAFAGLELDKQPLLAAQSPDGRFTASVATNVSIDQITREVVKSRGSSVWVDADTLIKAIPASPVADERVMGTMEYRYQSGAKRYIFRTASGFYLLNSTMSAASTLLAVNNEGMQKPSYAQVGRHLIIVDGSGAYYWDGESASLASTRILEPPKAWGYYAERPKMVLASGGSLVANTSYSVMITFYNGTTHSPPLPCGTIRTDGTNQTITLSTGYGYAGSATANGTSGNADQWMPLPNGTTYVYVWVLEDNDEDEKIYYQYTTVAANASTENTELTASISAVTETTPLPTFQGPPGGVSVVCNHAGRAFYTGSPGWPIRIWFSEPGQPFTIKGTSWIDVGDFSDPNVGLVSFPYGSQLLGILKRHSVWSLAGYDDASFLTGLQPETHDIGCIAPHAVYRKDRTAFFLGTGGIYAWTQNDKPVDITSSIRSDYLASIKGAT